MTKKIRRIESAEPSREDTGTIDVGKWAEECVWRWYEERGHRHVERNVRCPFGEIDLITCDPDGTICFIEVKARHAASLLTPWETVTAAKRKRLIKTALWYIAQRGWHHKPMRFDWAAVSYTSGGRVEIAVEKNVWTVDQD